MRDYKSDVSRKRSRQGYEPASLADPIKADLFGIDILAILKKLHARQDVRSQLGKIDPPPIPRRLPDASFIKAEDGNPVMEKKRSDNRNLVSGSRPRTMTKDDGRMGSGSVGNSQRPGQPDIAVGVSHHLLGVEFCFPDFPVRKTIPFPNQLFDISRTIFLESCPGVDRKIAAD